MKVFTKLNTKIRNLHYLKTHSFNKLHITNFTTDIQSRSHLQRIQDRDADYVKRVIQSNEYTVSDFSNFMRVVIKTKNPELVERFVEEVPKHISKLDDLDIRKVISIVAANPRLHEETDLIQLIQSRNSELNEQIGLDFRKDFNDFSKFPLSIRFWVAYAKFREVMYALIRNTGLNLK